MTKKFIRREGILGQIKSCLISLSAGYHEAGIAMLMAAIDATAKKRYPHMKNNADRFKKFLAEEMGRQLNAWISIGNKLKDDRGKPVGDHIGAIYSLCRCFVLHEGSFSDQIEFEHDDADAVRIYTNEDGKLVFNTGFVNKMFHCVVYAPENKDIFTPEVMQKEIAPLGRQPRGPDHFVWKK